MEKDINIEDEETLNEAPVDETDKEAETEAQADNAAETADKAAEEEAEEADPLEKAQKEIEELKTQLLYKVAEFENYRKRTLKERAELILNGGEKFITSILPILDDDTDLHEAVAMVPGMGDDKKGKVIDCLQPGYKLNDKVIRHAKVAVGQ